MVKVKCGARVVRVDGPLEALAAGFGGELAGLGFAPLSAANHLWVMAHLSRWLGGRGLVAGELTPERIGEFLADRRAAGYVHWVSARGLAPLPGYLRRAGAVPGSVAGQPDGPLDVLVRDFGQYLVAERGLAASTVERRGRAARRFLCWWAARRGGFDLAALGPGDVQEFMVAECGAKSRGSAGLAGSDLRCLLVSCTCRGGFLLRWRRPSRPWRGGGEAPFRGICPGLRWTGCWRVATRAARWAGGTSPS